MPAYNVTVVHMLRVVGTLTITARNQEAVQAQAERMTEEGKFGTLTWDITDYGQRIDEWTEEESIVEIEEVTED